MKKTLKPKMLQSKLVLFKKIMIQHALTAFIPNMHASVNVRKLMLISCHMCQDHLLSNIYFLLSQKYNFCLEICLLRNSLLIHFQKF